MNSQRQKSTDNIQSFSLTFSCYMSYYYKVLTVCRFMLLGEISDTYCAGVHGLNTLTGW